jgi:Protein of unknown function (DUF2380)
MMKSWIVATLFLAVSAAHAQPSLLLLDFEMVDEMHDPASAGADLARLERAGPQLREAMAACPAYRVAETEPAKPAIALAASQNAYLYRCNGCTAEIGAAANVDQVAFAWVQKVSNLILNFNLEIRDVRNDSILVAKSVDVRGNTDQSWSRGIKSLARRVCEGAAR